MLIHGLSVPSIIWKDVAPQLVANGFRVLIYGAPIPAFTSHVLVLILALTHITLMRVYARDDIMPRALLF